MTNTSKKQSITQCVGELTGGSSYYTLDNEGDIDYFNELFDNVDNYSYSTGNYFKTKEEAENHKQHLITHQKLKDIALELNNGKKISWNNHCHKYYIYFSYIDNSIHYSFNTHVFGNDVYCLSSNFKDTAIERIGHDTLVDYLKYNA